jgi:hypothetical protein
MVCVPVPAVDGSNELPVTPGPENIPPDGEPVSVTADAFTHIAATGVILGVGSGLTVTVAVALPPQLPELYV